MGDSAPRNTQIHWSLCPVSESTPQQNQQLRDAPLATLKTAKTGVMHAFLVLLSVIVFIAPYIVWEHRQTEPVVAQQPIGSLIGMTGTAGRGWPVVIETQLGFFPLRKAVSISPGTPLIAEERALGKRFVCNLGRTLCVQTSAASFSPLGHIQDKEGAR